MMHRMAGNGAIVSGSSRRMDAVRRAIDRVRCCDQCVECYKADGVCEEVHTNEQRPTEECE